MELIDPVGLGFSTNKVLDGTCKNSIDVTFRMAIGIDNPNAKELGLQDCSLHTWLIVVIIAEGRYHKTINQGHLP